ncbi:Rmi1 protein [Martiniozyma asiatica (nom. inval.)]|nr:Rmi1 protein [Martiniozyma asiatica]
MTTHFLMANIHLQRSTLTINHAHVKSKNLIPFNFNFQAPDNNQPILTLPETTLFQIIDIRDVYKSTLSYIELLRGLVDRNEGLVDRQRGLGSANSLRKNDTVINSVDLDENNQDEVKGSKMFKLTLQDAYGNLCYAIEIEPLHFLRKSSDLYPVKLGSKVLIHKGCQVCLNTIILRNTDIRFVGGEIEKWNYKLAERMLLKFKDELLAASE